MVVFYASPESSHVSCMSIDETMKYSSCQCRIMDFMVQLMIVTGNHKLMNVEYCT